MKITLHKRILFIFTFIMIMAITAACSKKNDEVVDTDMTITPTTEAEPTAPTASEVPLPTIEALTPTVELPSPTIEVPSPTVKVPSPTITAPTPTDILAVPTAKPTPKPTPKPVPTIIAENDGDDEIKTIAIDAGHQSKGNYDEEPIGPGAKTTKPKVSSGTQGAYTGVAEYELNLAVAKKVKDELIDRGYEVIMIRETNDVNLSNRERAELANESGADLFIRIHADGSENPEVNGASTLYPSKNNPYVPQLYKDSYNLAKFIVDSICDKTGAKNRGTIARDDMSGINWCTIPVTIIEMGYMTNKTEDKLMQTEEYQNKIAQGICDGIDAYFE